MKQAKLGDQLQIVKPSIDFHAPKGRGGKRAAVSSKIVIPVQSNKISIKAGAGPYGAKVKDSDEDDDDVALSLSEDDDELSSVESDEEDDLIEAIGKRKNLIRIGASGDTLGIDASRLTKRQRMTIDLEKQTKEITHIGRHNKDALLKGSVSDNAFYALENKKPNQKPFEEEVEDEDEEEELSMPSFQSCPVKGGKQIKNAGFKSAVNQAEQDEKKRQQLDSILDELRLKFERKQQQIQNMNLEAASLSVFGKLMAYNQKLAQGFA